MSKLAMACASLALSLALATQVQACQRASQVTKQQLFDAATSVFTAHVVEVTETDGNSFPDLSGVIASGSVHVLKVKFRTIENIKGAPSGDMTVFSLSYGPGNCTIPMMVGWDYVFFDNEKAKHLITSLDGSTPFLNIDTPPAQTLLTELRSYRK